MTTRPSNTSVIVRTGASALNWYLLYRIWKRYGKGAAALAFGVSFSEAVYHAWPEIEQALRSTRKTRAVRRSMDDALASPEDFESFLRAAVKRQSSDPLSRLFIRPEDQE